MTAGADAPACPVAAATRPDATIVTAAAATTIDFLSTFPPRDPATAAGAEAPA